MPYTPIVADGDGEYKLRNTEIATLNVGIADAHPGILDNSRTITDTTFSPTPAVGKFGLVTYASTVHAYNAAVRVAVGKWLHLRRMKNVRDYGAALSGTNPLVDDSAAFQTALAETTAASGVAVVQGLWVPAGHALISSSLTPADGAWVAGEGLFSSALVLADNVDVPILDSSATLGRTMLNGLWFKPVNKANHVDTSFPLLKLTGSYLATIQNCYIQNAPNDGALIGSGSGGAGSDSLRSFYWFITGCNGNGAFLDHCLNSALYGWDFEGNGKNGIRWRGSHLRAFQSGLLSGGRTELNLDYGIFIERAAGIHVKQHYSDNEASVYLGENVALCSVEDSTLIGLAAANPTKYNAIVTNLGPFNRVAQNDGICNPFDKPIEHYWPASLVPDPDESSRGTTFWRTSGATVTKSFTHDGVRMWRFFGKCPVKITSTSADTHYAYKEVSNVVAGDSLWFHVYYTTDIVGGGVREMRVRVVDDAAPTVDLYNSGALSVSNSGNGQDWCEERHSFCFRVPTGVTKLRLILQPVTATSILSSRQDVIRSGAVVNPGFDSVTGFAYASGIASGWANLSGTGTPSEETTIVKNPGSAQKIVTTGGNSKFLSQTVTLDPDRYYHLRGFIYVAAGSTPEYAVIGFGSDLTANYQVRLPIFETGVWRGVDTIFRPNGYDKLIIGVLNTCTAYFQDVTLTPLRNEGEFPWKFTSAELTLAGAAQVSYLYAPSIDERIRRAKIVFSSATTGASAAITVGVPGDPARFGTYTPPGVIAQWTEQEIALSRTDLRSINPATTGSLPLQVATVGGGAGAGRCFVTVEGGGGP